MAFAVGEGQASGMLSVEDGNAVLEALSRFFNGEQEAGLYSKAANRRMPMDRAAFERALEVSPMRDDPGKVAQARRIIAMNLERRHATSDDRDRGAAWLARYDQWLDTQLRESQEDPPEED